MQLAARKDLFRFQLPKVFVPMEIRDRWRPYFERQPMPTSDVVGILNYTIQSVTVPNFNFQPVEQGKPGNADIARGTTRQWRQSMSPEMLIDRQFSVTFKLIDGYVNYWIMMETFFHYYAFSTREPFTCDMPVRILDDDGSVMYTVTFHDVLYTGLSDFELTYSELDVDLMNFTADFSFNEMTVQFDEG